MEEKDYNESKETLFDKQQPTTKTYKVTEMKMVLQLSWRATHCNSLESSKTQGFTSIQS